MGFGFISRQGLQDWLVDSGFVEAGMYKSIERYVYYEAKALSEQSDYTVMMARERNAGILLAAPG